MSKKAGGSVDTGSNKKLKVQVGVCKRLQKEVASYEKEVSTNEARIQKMKEDGKDEYDIRKQEEVLQESYMMVPDSNARLEAAIMQLSTVLEEISGEPDIDAALLEEARLIVDPPAAP